jgi:hypothetical protein
MKKIFFPSLILFVIMSTHGHTQNLADQKPVKVELEMLPDSSFQFLRNGEPYYIKGAGGSQYIYRVAAYGGNSIRTWSTQNGKEVLDSAHKNGLTVLMGLSVARERHGFDYDDEDEVEKQLQNLKNEVEKYKSHPALLAWGIGNELNLEYSNPKVWDAVNDISKMIHEIDPNHPTTTVLAGTNKAVIDLIKERCTDIDLLSINTYGGLESLPRTIRNVGWDGPYMVTEWGPTGHWEGLQTAWDIAIEETSSEKAAVYRRRYNYSMNRDKKRCLGSYVFLWGQKQERTPTWYGLFTEAGEESEVLDVMHFLWSGKWPENKAPHIYSLQLDNQNAVDNIYLQPNKEYSVLAVATDPENESLTYRWEILPEPKEFSVGGDREDRPQPVPDRISSSGEGLATMKAPEKEGPYRVFVYVTDDQNKVATANVPFFVKP